MAGVASPPSHAKTLDRGRFVRRGRVHRMIRNLENRDSDELFHMATMMIQHGSKS